MKRLIVLALAVAAAGALLVVPAFAAHTRTIRLKDDVFSPTRVTVAKGTTVKWVWAGQSPHNVTVITGPTRFRSGMKMQGATYTRKLTRTGTYKINCTIHPGMNETIRVR